MPENMTQITTAAMARALAATPDPAARSAMYAFVLGWMSDADPDLFLSAVQAWRQNSA